MGKSNTPACSHHQLVHSGKLIAILAHAHAHIRAGLINPTNVEISSIENEIGDRDG